jgi:hypothetical protein
MTTAFCRTISCELHHIQYVHFTRRTSFPLIFLVFLVAISKRTFKDSNSGLQMNFFRESGTFWAKSALTLWRRFSGSGSTNWTDALQHCSLAANGKYVE